MKLDKTDKKILWNMEYNARRTKKKIASAAGISKQNLNYRIRKLTENGVIRGFRSVIDVHQVGHMTYRVYYRYAQTTKEEETRIISYFKNHDHTLWVASIIGAWDLEVIFIARNYIQFNNMIKQANEELGHIFTKQNISMTPVNYHFKRDYLLEKERGGFEPAYYGFEPKKNMLDPTDTQILSELAKDCSRSNSKIGKAGGVSYQTVGERTKKMEDKGIIQAHRLFVDFRKLGVSFYKALITLNNPTKEDVKQLYAFCASFNNVVYLIEVVGQWHFEIEVETKRQEELISIIRAIRNRFGSLILDYSIVQISKEHKLHYFPLAAGTD